MYDLYASADINVCEIYGRAVDEYAWKQLRNIEFPLAP